MMSIKQCIVCLGPAARCDTLVILRRGMEVMAMRLEHVGESDYLHTIYPKGGGFGIIFACLHVFYIALGSTI